MKKTAFSLALILLLCSVFTSCSGTSSETASDPEAEFTTTYVQRDHSEGLNFVEIWGGSGPYAYRVEAGNCTDSEIVIPKEYNGLPVILIDYNAFKEHAEMTQVYIPDSVTNIGEYAFAKSRALKSVVVPDSVTTLGIGVFQSCSSLEGAVLPKGLTTIPYNTFANCSSLKSIEIPAGVTVIDTDAFYGCSALKSVVIPDGAELIASTAFYGCYSLESITIPASVKKLGKSVFRGNTKMENIYYGGTKAQWNALEKGQDWDKDIPSYTVHCSDGDIVK